VVSIVHAGKRIIILLSIVGSDGTALTITIVWLPTPIDVVYGLNQSNICHK